MRPEFEPTPYYEPPEFQYGGGRGGGRGRGGRFGQRKDYGTGGGGKDYYDNYSGSRYMILIYINVWLLVLSALPSLLKPIFINFVPQL